MRFSNPSTQISRSCAALGIKDQNCELVSGSANIALSSGTVRYAYIPLVAGDVVSAVHFWLNVVAGTVTTIKAGLYSYSGTTGTRLASSANDTSAFNTLGLTTHTMTTPYTVLTTGHYLVALISVATTPGSIQTSGTADGVTGKASGTVVFGGTEGGQTDLDASSTISPSTVSSWCGWS